MSDVPQERTDLPQEPYRPFPTFAEFAVTGVDLSTFAEFVSILDEAKAQATPEHLQEAVRRATKWAAVDTGAIEGLYDVDRGFTFSVAATAAAWDSMDLKIGEAAARSINDALTAYDFVLDIVTDLRPITETWVKELHEVICASQETYQVLTGIGMQEQPLPKGVYKTQQNNPFNLHRQAVHNYAPVLDTPAEMHRMIEELASDEFAAAEPVLQAAYAHYAFVCIHPFADGNGRVARALASVYLYRSPGVPLVVFADQKGEYLDALEAADAGRSIDLIRFVTDRAVDSIGMIQSDLGEDADFSSSDLREDLVRSLGDRQRQTMVSDEVLARRLLAEWARGIENAFADLGIKDLVSIALEERDGYIGDVLPLGYTLLPGVLEVRAALVQPGAAERTRWYAVAIEDVVRADLALSVVRSHYFMINALRRELAPSVGTPLKYRLASATATELRSLVSDLMS